jgi:predicted lysophospholipase L1 biosynthesis ABC-type transport system permease subunit
LAGGDITIGAAVSAGVAYYLSATAGGICPVADLVSTNYPVILGIAKSTTVLSVKITEAGVAL